MKFSRREWIWATAGSLSGCRRRNARQRRGDSITVLYPYDDTVLSPDMNEPAQFLMFLPLVAWNRTGELEGRLAEHWEHSPDYRTWTVQLRDGIRWHDGVKVTSHDIKCSLDMRMHPEVMWYPPGSYAIKVLDELTYTITYERNSMAGSGLDDWTAFYPKHWLEKIGPKNFYTAEFWTHPVGNGPYRHLRTIPKTMLHLEASPTYYRGKPRIENVILKFDDSTGSGMTAATIELLSGDADAATAVSRTDILKLRADPRFRVHQQINKETVTTLFWNHNHPLFGEARIRKALTMAINRRELFQLLNFPADTPVLDGPFSERQLRRREFPPPIPHDPDAANRLLDEAGWSRRDGQGIRQRDGKAFAFRMIRGSQGAAGQNEAAVYIQAELRRVGVRVNIDPLEGPAVFRRVVTGDYESAICIMFTNWADPRFLPTAGYASPRFQELAVQLERAFDPAQEDRVHAEMARLFAEDVPATFLYPDVMTTVASNRIHGIENSPYRGDLTWCMEELSLAGESA